MLTYFVYIVTFCESFSIIMQLYSSASRKHFFAHFFFGLCTPLHLVLSSLGKILLQDTKFCIVSMDAEEESVVGWLFLSSKTREASPLELKVFENNFVGEYKVPFRGSWKGHSETKAACTSYRYFSSWSSDCVLCKKGTSIFPNLYLGQNCGLVKNFLCGNYLSRLARTQILDPKH